MHGWVWLHGSHSGPTGRSLGALVLKVDEVQPVIQKLQAGKIGITALDNHFSGADRPGGIGLRTPAASYSTLLPLVCSISGTEGGVAITMTTAISI